MPLRSQKKDSFAQKWAPLALVSFVTAFIAIPLILNFFGFPLLEGGNGALYKAMAWLGACLAFIVLGIAYLQMVSVLKKSADQTEKAVNFRNELLSNMNHELRTPLNGILGLSSILLKTELTQEQKELTEHIQRSADNLYNLVNEILDVSKIESEQLQLRHIPFDLKQIVSDEWTILSAKAAEKGVDFQLHYGSDIPHHFIGDPLRISQIFNHIMSNAIKFTDNGSISIEIATIENDHQSCIVQCAIKDTGVGISSEDQKKIFDSFTQVDKSETRTQGGIGIGLSLTHKLVELMGGEISLESQVGKGSEFKIRLPLKKDNRPKKHTLSDIYKGAQKKGQLSILVVEDNTVNQKVALNMLERFHFKVKVVDNGKQAVESFKNDRFDAIFMDCQMPVMDGFTATMEIRSIEAAEGMERTPIIALTASVGKGDEYRCYDAGMDAFVPKPFKEFDIITVLTDFCGGQWFEISGDKVCQSMEKDLDPDVVKELREVVGDSFDKLIKEFVKSSREILEAIHQSVKENNYSDVVFQGHKLKSSSAQVGAKRLSELACELENRAKKENLKGAKKLCDQAFSSLEAFEEEYQALVSSS